MPPPSHAATAAEAPRSPWIQGPALDLLLFIGVPVLLIPLILLRPGRPDVQQLILYAGSFGALGHHLPGMLRAYGDRELFARFRTRLVLAPLFLIGVCVGFSVTGLHGVVLVTFVWTTWHTLMQVFGFGRIYDAKVGSFSAVTSRLDHLLCIAWIGAPLAWSSSRAAYLMELYHRSGGPLLPPGLVSGARVAWLVLTGLVTAIYLGTLAASLARGARPSGVKLGLFVVSFGFWWFCMVEIDHLVAGIALFDVFHDVQYLALVWLFQRGRVARGEGVTGFTRFLFRRSGALIGLYVGLVIGYGSLGFFAEDVQQQTLRNVLLGVLTASALFHFYLDGFIWKVREGETRRQLGLASEAPKNPSPVTRHGVKWLGLALPLAALGALELRGGPAESEWRHAITQEAPGGEALTNLGALRAREGDLEHALALHEQAVEAKPTHAEAHHNLGTAQRLVGRLDEALTSFERALELRPDYPRAHGHLANTLLQLGRSDEAEVHFLAALEDDPTYADPRANLGVLLLQRGERRAAAERFREALAIEPDNQGALNNLAWLLATTGDPSLRDPDAALALAERLVELTERRIPQGLDTLAAALAAAGRFDEAAFAADEALGLLEGADAARTAPLEARRTRYEAGEALIFPVD